MRVLASIDIALRVLMLLGRRKPGEQTNVESIALQFGGLSRNPLHKIVQDLAALASGELFAAPAAASRSRRRWRKCEWDH